MVSSEGVLLQRRRETGDCARGPLRGHGCSESDGREGRESSRGTGIFSGPGTGTGGQARQCESPGVGFQSALDGEMRWQAASGSLRAVRVRPARLREEREKTKERRARPANGLTLGVLGSACVPVCVPRRPQDARQMLAMAKYDSHSGTLPCRRAATQFSYVHST